MMTKWTIRKAACVMTMFAAGLLIDTDLGSWFAKGPLVPDAQARVGRPLTPVSVAGVARRTTRRTIRRSTIYLNTLPVGCPLVNGLYFCGGTYYQPYGGRYVVVYVD